jgi:hypothetical protein
VEVSLVPSPPSCSVGVDTPQKAQEESRKEEIIKSRVRDEYLCLNVNEQVGDRTSDHTILIPCLRNVLKLSGLGNVRATLVCISIDSFRDLNSLPFSLFFIPKGKLCSLVPKNADFVLHKMNFALTSF